MRIPLYLLIPLFIIGGGLYAIPYQISLSSMNLMSAVCGVFLFAMMFSLPGAWIQRGHFIPGRKSIAGVIAVALFGIAANYSLCLLYTSPSPRDKRQSRMPSSA